MTRNELYTILLRCGLESTPIHTLDKIWGQAFDGETEKITKKVEGEDHATTRQRLKMAHDAIRIASDAFEQVNMWEEGECGSTDMIDCLKDFLPIPNGTTYTRSYQVFLPNPNQPNP